jgi:Flp pilus assembly pilin Flp
MLTFVIKLKDLLSREEGQDLIEYVLIIALIALACIGGVGGFGVLVQALTNAINAAAAQIFS